MVSIAICDDQILFVEKFREYLKKYFEGRSVEYQLFSFSDPKELYESMKDNCYQIIFMDLEFDSPEKDGILWSKKINETYPKTLVLILTAYESRIKEGYVARAYRFMTKPLIWMEFKENLNACLDEIKNSTEIFVQIYGTEVAMAIRDIVYLEAHAGGSILHTTSNQYYCGESLLQWEKKLPVSHFYRCNKMYLINLSYISRLENHFAHLTIDKKLSVSRRKWTELLKKYIEFDISR